MGLKPIENKITYEVNLTWKTRDPKIQGQWVITDQK